MTTPTTIEELDEMRARAIDPYAFSAKPTDAFIGLQPNGQPQHVTLGKWWLRNQKKRATAFAVARAIREADEAAGLVTVPREPTYEMAYAMCQHVDTQYGTGKSHHDVARVAYQHTVDASPFRKAK